MESRRPGATVGVCRVVKELGVVRQVFGVLLPGQLFMRKSEASAAEFTSRLVPAAPDRTVTGISNRLLFIPALTPSA